MLVCHCHAVTSSQVRGLVVDGVCTLNGIARMSGAGSDCGSCVSVIRDLIEHGATLGPGDRVDHLEHRDLPENVVALPIPA